MKTNSLIAISTALILLAAVKAVSAAPPTTLASSWSPARRVVGLELQRGNGVMQIVLNGPPLTWDESSEPYVREDVAAGCDGSKRLEIEIGGDEDEVRRMTDTAMRAFMTGTEIELSIELTHCSANGRYLVRDIREL